MKVKVSPMYQSLHDWLGQIPRWFADNQGEVLYDGRNQIRLFIVDGKKLVVKRYKKHDIIKTISYTFFRPNKAKRAFEHAVSLKARGFQTPHEVAYLEKTTAGFVRQVYYVCTYTDKQPIEPRLIDQTPYDKELATAYAHFVASLHETGVLHRDLNPTNVLYQQTNQHFDFELIDINRMRFFEGAVPKAECMENLTLFWWYSPVYQYILDVYAADRGWTQEDIAEACEVKRKHDKRWVRRKRITHMFRKKK